MRIRLAACSSLLLFLACGPSPYEATKDLNVVLVVIDTLRADRLVSYGGEDPRLTPTLDRLAREGVVFENARSTSSYTRESVSSLFTGLWPSASGAVGRWAVPAPEAPTLAELYRARGFATGLLSNSNMLKLDGYDRGFDVVDFLTRGWGVSGQGPRLSERAGGFLRRHTGQNFFLYLHYLDPHAPYEPSEELRKELGVERTDPELHLYKDVRPRIGALRAEGFGPGEARFTNLHARYQAETLASDRALAQLLDEMEQNGVLDDTLLIVTSDHGEEFLEHGFVAHGWTLFEESIRVPLILWAPRHLAPARVADDVSLADLLPTLATLGRFDAPRPVDGKSLVRGSFEWGRPDSDLISETLILERNHLRAIVRDGHKYLAALRFMTPEERSEAASNEEEIASAVQELGEDPRRKLSLRSVFEPLEHEALYDLESDPGERHNLLDEDEALRDLWRSRLDDYEALCADRAVVFPPSETPIEELSDEERETLRSLGYF